MRVPLKAGITADIVEAEFVLPAARQRRGKNSVAAAAYDEDTVTLAAEAALAVTARAPAPPAALLLATVSAPLTEGGAAQLIAEIAGLSGARLHVQEHGGTRPPADLRW